MKREECLTAARNNVLNRMIRKALLKLLILLDAYRLLLLIYAKKV